MIVLPGLAYFICEGYIDDIIVHGQDDSDLLVNLRLDADGIHFSAEQLSEVAEFPTPVGAKGLCSFLGLANYFRDHVRHYADMERPMRDVLTKHDKSKKFQWSEPAVTVPNCISPKTSPMHKSYCAPMHLITVKVRIYVRLLVNASIRYSL